MDVSVVESSNCVFCRTPDDIAGLSLARGDRPRGAEAPREPRARCTIAQPAGAAPRGAPLVAGVAPGRAGARSEPAVGGRCPAAARTEPDATAPSADGSEPRTELQPAARPAGGDVHRPAASAVALAGPRPARRESDATGISSTTTGTRGAIRHNETSKLEYLETRRTPPGTGTPTPTRPYMHTRRAS